MKFVLFLLVSGFTAICFAGTMEDVKTNFTHVLRYSNPEIQAEVLQPLRPEKESENKAVYGIVFRQTGRKHIS